MKDPVISKNPKIQPNCSQNNSIPKFIKQPSNLQIPLILYHPPLLHTSTSNPSSHRYPTQNPHITKYTTPFHSFQISPFLPYKTTSSPSTIQQLSGKVRIYHQLCVFWIWLLTSTIKSWQILSLKRREKHSLKFAWAKFICNTNFSWILFYNRNWRAELVQPRDLFTGGVTLDLFKGGGFYGKILGFMNKSAGFQLEIWLFQLDFFTREKELE